MSTESAAEPVLNFCRSFRAPALLQTDQGYALRAHPWLPYAAPGGAQELSVAALKSFLSLNKAPILDTLTMHSHNATSSHADVAELADAQVSEACDGDIVEVQVLSSAPITNLIPQYLN